MQPATHPSRTAIGAFLGIFLAILIPAATLHAQPSIPAGDKPLLLDGRLAKAGTITNSPDPAPADLIEVEMLKDRLGILHQLETKSLSSINRLARLETDPQDLGAADYYLHFSRGVHSGVLSVHLHDESVILSNQEETSRVWRVRRDAFEKLEVTLGSDVADSETTIEPVLNATKSAMSLVLPTPHVESEIVLDAKTRRTRFKINYPDFSRVLGNETFRVRLPEDFDPNVPAGVLVHISPTPSGKIIEIYGPVCDELGLIAIGVDNNGNKRDITDRLQNHLDSIETLAQHARIDRDRIYLTGMSGGGRCSSLLLLAFPDYFAGAVPIVGLDTYHNAPTSRANEFWPRRLSKPAGRWMNMLKNRRIRSITGSADFNEPEMRIRTEMLQRDGIDAQLDTIRGMGHAYPTAGQFEDALLWVDEPRRVAIQDAREKAVEILKATENEDFDTPGVRRAMIELMNTLPYSDFAWEGAKRLGYPRED